MPARRTSAGQRRAGAARVGAAVASLAWVPVLMLPAAAAAQSVSPAPASTPTAAIAEGPCGAALDTRQRRVVVGPHHQLAFEPVPAPLVAGRHLALNIVVCPRGGASQPVALRVDADMPAHRHGMNYKPTVRPQGDAHEGRWRADGLLLHMPGRWRLLFELSADGRLDRLVHTVDIE